ncbi:MAG: phosphate butyryltransferase [Tissierellia bacterium]|nr:phosphate butyryltransferase [Tissierellia bacterium]
MISSFKQVRKLLINRAPITVAVACAADEEILKAVSIGVSEGYAKAILTGKRSEIEVMIKNTPLSESTIIDCANDEEAVMAAVKEVKADRADLLMKGLVNTSVFMRGVLNRENGLREAPLLSMLGIFELPFYHKLLFITDSGINVAPSGDQKAIILSNALDAMGNMGVKNPKVGVLTANEAVDPKVQSTVDAAYLVKEWEEGRWSNAIVEGPMAFDVMFNKKAAEHKGIESDISGDVDLMLVPNIETGNALAKSWLLFNNAQWAGLVLGAKKPILLGSRSDSAEVKALSLAVAALLI